MTTINKPKTIDDVVEILADFFVESNVESFDDCAADDREGLTLDNLRTWGTDKEFIQDMLDEWFLNKLVVAVKDKQNKVYEERYKQENLVYVVTWYKGVLGVYKRRLEAEHAGRNHLIQQLREQSSHIICDEDPNRIRLLGAASQVAVDIIPIVSK